MKVCEKCHREGAVGRINHEHGGIAWKHEDCQSEHAESVHVDNDLNTDTPPLRQLILFQKKRI